MTIDDLTTPLTLDQAKATIYAVLVQLGVPTTGWAAGAVVRTIVSLVAVLLVAASVLIVSIAKGGLREKATGDWQTLHAQDVYGITRISATFASGTATLQNVAGGVYNPAAGDTIIQDTATGKTFRNSAAYSLAAGTIGSPSTVVIDVVAIEAGSPSNVAASCGTLVLATPLSGVSVSDNTAIVGVDEETDSQLQIREDESLDALSPFGPAGAYLAAAKTAVRADGTNVGVTRAIVSAPSSTGVVTVTVASAAGAVSGTVGTPGTDLDYVNIKIQELATPAGITVTVQSATAKTITGTYEMWVYTTDSRTTVQQEAAITAAWTAWMATRPIGGDTGGYVYHGAIRSLLMNALAIFNGTTWANYAYNCAVTVPASDTPIGAAEVPVAGTLTCTAIHQVTPPW